MVDVTAKLPAIITGAAKPLASRDVHTVGDVLRFLPTRYRSYDSDLGGLVEGDVVVVIGEVLRSSGHTPKYNRRGWVFTAVLTDPAGRQIDMTFFNRGHDAKLHAGVKVIAGGEVTSFNGLSPTRHPGYSVLEEGRHRLPGLLPITRPCRSCQLEPHQGDPARARLRLGRPRPDPDRGARPASTRHPGRRLPDAPPAADLGPGRAGPRPHAF